MVSVKDIDDEEGTLQDEHQLSGLDSDEDLHKPELNGHDDDNEDEPHEAEIVPSSPNEKDSKKKEKDEKKRLEKEKKEREKKEKEEAKRLKKEEEKQLKGDKSSSRKSEREKKQAVSPFSPKRPGVRPKAAEVACRVLLLDGSEFVTNVDKYAYGQHLVDEICKYVNVLERDYFSCTYTGKRGIRFWLIHDRRIIKQMGEGLKEWVFEFEVKFYSPEPITLHEDLTRYQLCLQLRSDISSGKLPCSFVTYALLGSYTAQSEFGDYEPEEHGVGLDYVRDIQFAPNQTDDLLQKIVELHKTHAGQMPSDAELNYLENAKKLQMYGVHIYPAKDYELVLIGVGVSARGITIFRDGQKINHFAWPKILKMSYKHKKFYLKIRPAEFEQYENTIGFQLESHTHAKNLWRIAIEHHTFFRMKEPLPVQTGLFAQFGSKFRYSGRTFYQSRNSRIDRPAPEFDRTSSRRMTGSRSMDYGGSSFEHDTSRLHSTSLDFKTKKKGYDDDMNRSGTENQISVLAGTGPDASTVAYVKTVRPDHHDLSQEFRDDEKNRYQEINGFDDAPQVSSFSRDRFSRNAPDASTNNRPIAVTAVINQSQSYDEESESLPPYPHPHDDQDGPPQTAPKKKSKKKTATKTSKQSYTAADGSTVTEYKTEKTAVIETRTQNDFSISYSETDIDHDLALANAIQQVTEVDTNLNVDQIQVDPSQLKKTKKKKREKLLAA